MFPVPLPDAPESDGGLAADSPHLLGLVAQYREVVGCDPKELSADAGYYSAAIFARGCPRKCGI